MKKHSKNTEKLLELGASIKTGILGCIQGDWDICRQNSLVCKAHKKGRKAPIGLPERNYVTLTSADALVIGRWIDNKIGHTAMIGQKHNLTTNRCEASHLSVLKGSPKCRNRARNFAGRAKSAIHSVSIGLIDSVLTANTILGAENLESCPANLTRQQLRASEQYYKDIRKSSDYRITKYKSQARARRIRQQRQSSTGYSTGVQNPVVRHDHSYTS
ncbi:uncharacterized protein [Amphiura filiformis]|uniref:uncharacterized protein n=1 Tax=Amphiura filiformis TaxID=82378 RepID=UPI003B22856C